jgi:CubicO group peptidase (beta-lactamase class C family)
MARLDERQPITTATVFDVASISKQFTAMSVMLLVRDGKISLDRDVSAYLPEWVNRTDRVTVRQVLAHTAGLRDVFLLTELAEPPPAGENINDRLLRILAQQRGLNFTPGSQFSYNNGGYNVLGGIVKRVSGEPLPTFVDTRIFRPLGMSHSVIAQAGMPIVPERAWGYHQDDSGTMTRVPLDRSNATPVVGNAGLTTTVRDLLVWEQNLAAPRVGDRAIVETMETAVTLAGGSKSPFGLGLEVGEDRGLKTTGHGGSDRGIAAYVIRYPQRALAVAVLCNLDNIGYRVGALARDVAGVYLPDDHPATPAVPQHTTTGLPPDTLARVAGLYRDIDTGTHSRLYVRDGVLMASIDAGDGPGDSLPLTPAGADRFVLSGTPVVAEFVPGAAGRPDRFRVTGDGPAPRISERVDTGFTPTPAQLRAYAGRYRNEDLNVVYTLIVRGSTLVIQIPGREDIVLAPIFKDGFHGSLVDLIRFSRDANGAVTGFAINRVTVRNLPFQRLR